MKIIIEGAPVPQARMKASVRAKFVCMYDPVAKEKEVIRTELRKHASGEVFNYPRISFLFCMPIPKSLPKKTTEVYMSGLSKHDKKPDVDNLIKLYLDCLDGIIIQGDQKVSLGPCIKTYSAQPRTVIWISETGSLVDLSELGREFSTELKSGELS